MPITTYGQVYPLDAGPGVGLQDMLTGAPNAGSGLVLPENGAPAASVAGIVNNDAKPKTNYVPLILAGIVLLFVVQFTADHFMGADKELPFTRMGFASFLFDGFKLVLFIVCFKALANMYPASQQLTDLANAI